MLNTSVIQASIEFFGIILCILEIILFKSIIDDKKSSRRFLILTLIGNIVMLLTDILWNMYDGNTTELAVIVNHLSNFGTFIANSFTISMVAHYINALVRESNKGTGKKFFLFEQVLMGLTLIMPVANLFYPWLYSFTSENEYYRLSGWYIYTACILVALVAGLVFMIISRKDFKPVTFWAILAFYGLPCLGSVFQALWGGAFVNAGSTLGLLILGFVHIQDWIQTEKLSITSRKRSATIFTNLFITMSVCIAAIFFASLLSLNSSYVEQNESNNLVVAHMVNETIDSALTEPVAVANTMAHSSILKESLSYENLAEGSSQEKILTRYLTSIKEGLGYQMAFAASDSTKNYYTYKGLSKHLDLESDAHDVWYTDIVNSSTRYVLNIDTDEVNGLTRAVFINMKVTDDDGDILGICGVGVPLEELQKLLSSIEDEYNIKVQLIKPDGLVQIDTDSQNVEQTYLDNSYLESVPEEDFLYEASGDTIRMTEYLPDFGWYLVVTKDKNLASGFIAEIFPSVLITLLGIIIMAAIYMLFRSYESSMDKAMEEKERTASIDELTGLYNRYALEKYRNEQHPEGWKNHLAVIVMDLNGLKNANDTKGHLAGDELLQATAQCIQRISPDSYRTGGDEFRIYIEDCTREMLDETIDRLRAAFAASHGTHFDELTVSIGGALGCEWSEFNLTELEEKADELMYADKSAYYKQTGKNRRKN